MLLKKVCIIGWGNISKYVKYSIDNSLEFDLACVVRRKKSLNETVLELANTLVVDDISKVDNIDIAVLCVPEKNIEILTEELIERKINSINFCDDEKLSYQYMLQQFDNKCKKNNVNVFHSFGFYSGMNEIIKDSINFMTDTGVEYTNLGPGIDIQYTSIVKNIAGVKNALVFIEPLSISKHSIKAYIEIEENTDYIDVRKKILNEIEFKYENIDIELVDDVNKYYSMNMKYSYSKIGTSSKAFNQNMNFNMNVNISGVVASIVLNGIRQMKSFNGGVYNLKDVFFSKK